MPDSLAGSGHRLLGSGSSADVWDVGGERVLKRYHEGVSNIPVELEYQASLLAFQCGLAVAKPLALMQYLGRPAILFERIEGPTMLSVMHREPLKMWPLIVALARYHVAIHRHRAALPIMPTMHDVLGNRIARSAAGSRAISAATARLGMLPAGDRLCHGDLHPDNILLRNGTPVAIDWSKAAIGTPAADVARSEMLLRFGHGGRAVPAGMRVAQAITAHWYRWCYLRASGAKAAEVKAWHLPIAVAWYRGQPQLDAAGLPEWIERQVRPKA